MLVKIILFSYVDKQMRKKMQFHFMFCSLSYTWVRLLSYVSFFHKQATAESVIKIYLI